MKISLQSASSFEGKHPCLGSSSIWAGQWCWRSSSCGTIDIGTLGRSQHPDLSSPQGSATPTRIGLGILSRSDKYLLDFFRLLPEKWTGLYQMISDYIYIYHDISVYKSCNSAVQWSLKLFSWQAVCWPERLSCKYSNSVGSGRNSGSLEDTLTSSTVDWWQVWLVQSPAILGATKAMCALIEAAWTSRC